MLALYKSNIVVLIRRDWGKVMTSCLRYHKFYVPNLGYYGNPREP